MVRCCCWTALPFCGVVACCCGVSGARVDRASSSQMVNLIQGTATPVTYMAVGNVVLRVLKASQADDVIREFPVRPLRRRLS